INAAPAGTHSSALVGIPGRPPRPGSWPAGCTFAARCAAATDACRAELPPLVDLDGERRVRCIHPIAEPRVAPTRTPIARPEEAVGSSIVVNGLRASYGKTTVLHDVSLEARAGRCTAIVGESGSGKTTLAQCLVGLNQRWSGEALLDEVPLAPAARRRTLDQRRRLQYIFQNPYGSLNPRQSVAENLEEALAHFEPRLDAGARRDRIDKVLEQVALSAEYADRMPDQLSGGERQRVAIGRALIVDPTVLVCDEVTSALDVSVQALIVEQLRELQRSTGLTMLFITHNLGVVQSIAQDVIVLRRGRVVEQGRVVDVLSTPQHPYTQQLLRDLPVMEAAASGPVDASGPSPVLPTF
ncbi:MAG: oligopeptide/dipeptide ABC transporter ATP-binding protein, partial [Chloroflexota bacterium]